MKKEPAPAPRQTGSYTIYVSSFKEKARADKEKDRLAKMDYDAFIIPHDGMYRVAVGRFTTPAEAKKLTAELKSLLKTACWVDKIE